MRKLPFFFILSMSIIIFHGTAFADSAILQDPGTGQLYQRIDAQITWHDARDACLASSGYLATITSQAENDFVFTSVGVLGQDHWLGATEELVEGTWVWVTGEPWSYTNWGTGQPNNFGEDQDYLSFWYNEASKWNDQSSVIPLPRPNWGYICEWDPECRITGDCDDSNACTINECIDWECQSSALDCDDLDDCTDDSCDSVSGCVNICNASGPNNLCCNQTACAGAPVCQGGYSQGPS